MANLANIFDGAIGRPDLQEQKEGLNATYGRYARPHPDREFMDRLRRPVDPGRILQDPEKAIRAAELLAREVSAANEARRKRKREEHEMLEIVMAAIRARGVAVDNAYDNWCHISGFQITIIKIEEP